MSNFKQMYDEREQPSRREAWDEQTSARTSGRVEKKSRAALKGWAVLAGGKHVGSRRKDWAASASDRFADGVRAARRCLRRRPLQKLEEAIRESHAILDLGNDWDGDGSPAIEFATWERATAFLHRIARYSWERLNLEIDAPRIHPGPEGSVDIEWSDSERELLINIPADTELPAGFYGDDRDKLKIKGTFDPTSVNLGIIEWLTKAR